MDATTAPPAVTADELARLREVARRIRLETIRAVMRAKSGHAGGPLSVAVRAFLEERSARGRDDGR